MLENQSQQFAYENNYVYEVISDSSLQSLDKQITEQPASLQSQQQQLPAYKYWNPATIEDNFSGSHAPAKVETIGEFSNYVIRWTLLVKIKRQANRKVNANVPILSQK